MVGMCDLNLRHWHEMKSESSRVVLRGPKGGCYAVLPPNHITCAASQYIHGTHSSHAHTKHTYTYSSHTDLPSEVAWPRLLCDIEAVQGPKVRAQLSECDVIHLPRALPGHLHWQAAVQGLTQNLMNGWMDGCRHDVC